MERRGKENRKGKGKEKERTVGTHIERIIELTARLYMALLLD